MALFKGKTYEGIVAPLRKIIQDLRAHAEDKHLEAENHERIAAEHAQAHNDCVDEADASMETAENIANLIGEPAAESQQ